MSRLKDERVVWKPNPGRQTRFLSHTADEVLLGGEAGGGKSDALVAAPLYWVENPNFNALILRREATDLAPLLRKSEKIYPYVFPGARMHQGKNIWTFPSGAKIRFAGCEHERDAFAYQGDEFNYIGFDELTHFTRTQYLELISRNRTSDPTLPTIARCTTNPGGDHHDWVLERWAAWLDPSAQIHGLDRSQYPGGLMPEHMRLWFLRDEDGTERVVPKGTPEAQSRAFLRSVRAECKQLDPKYIAKLNNLDPVRREQLKKGNFLAKPAAGKYFQRRWVELIDHAPKPDRDIRYWDLAAGGDYASGTRSSRVVHDHIVQDVRRLRAGPGEVRQLVFNTAREDGRGVEIWIERDPGQAGKDQELTYVTAPELQGFCVRFRPKRVDKITAFAPFSAYAYSSAGLVKFVRGQWNRECFEELEAFPEGTHDDQCDSISGAHAVLFGGVILERQETDEEDVVASSVFEDEARGW